MNFDRLAPHYDWMEAVSGHALLQGARTAHLDALQGRRRILSVGEGHGRFASACSTRHPTAELTCVEASARMRALGQGRAPELPGRIRWIGRDVLAWEPVGTYDAIVTCFFLDCFTPDQLAVVVAKLAACAAPNAVWLVSDFALPQKGPARWRAQAVHALMYGFFRAVVALPTRQLTPPDSLLQAHGFQLVGRREFSAGLLRADLWQRSG